jgi:hypothetical protein
MKCKEEMERVALKILFLTCKDERIYIQVSEQNTRIGR